MEEGEPFQQMGAGPTEYSFIGKYMNLDLNIIPNTKINSQWIMNLTVKG